MAKTVTMTKPASDKGFVEINVETLLSAGSIIEDLASRRMTTVARFSIADVYGAVNRQLTEARQSRINVMMDHGAVQDTESGKVEIPVVNRTPENMKAYSETLSALMQKTIRIAGLTPLKPADLDAIELSALEIDVLRTAGFLSA